MNDFWEMLLSYLGVRNVRASSLCRLLWDAAKVIKKQDCFANQLVVGYKIAVNSSNLSPSTIVCVKCRTLFSYCHRVVFFLCFLFELYSGTSRLITDYDNYHVYLRYKPATCWIISPYLWSTVCGFCLKNNT